MQGHDVTDIDGLIAQVWSLESRALAEEAWDCYNAGAMRGPCARRTRPENKPAVRGHAQARRASLANSAAAELISRASGVLLTRADLARLRSGE